MLHQKGFGPFIELMSVVTNFQEPHQEAQRGSLESENGGERGKLLQKQPRDAGGTMD
jgi:hypothetical protein